MGTVELPLKEDKINNKKMRGCSLGTITCMTQFLLYSISYDMILA